MSGLEAIGVAASIIQVADLGTKLSVQLFSLYRRYKNANESIQLLSNEIALVSAILRELGDNLKKDESSKLCSEEAFRTLRLVLTQCRDVLGQIQKVVDGNDQSGKSRLQHVTGKFRIVLLEPSLDQLKVNLERLKSTMLLLLNVIMYAGQIRNYNVPVLVQEQRDLIRSLLDDRQVGSSKPRQPDEAAESPRDLSTNSTHPPDELAHLTIDGASCLEQNPISRNSRGITHGRRAEPQVQKATERYEPPELREYNTLIQKLLNELESCRSKLERTRHSRIKDGVFNIHSGEIVRFKTEYGPSIHIDHSLFSEQKTEIIHEANATEFAHTATSVRAKARSTGTSVVYNEEFDESDLYDSDMSTRKQYDRTYPRHVSKGIEISRNSVQGYARARRSSSPVRKRDFERDETLAVVARNERVPRALITGADIERRRIRGVYERFLDGNARRSWQSILASDAGSSDTFRHDPDPDAELPVRQEERSIVKRGATRYHVTWATGLQDPSISLTFSIRPVTMHDSRWDLRSWGERHEIERLQCELVLYTQTTADRGVSYLRLLQDGGTQGEDEMSALVRVRGSLNYEARPKQQAEYRGRLRMLEEANDAAAQHEISRYSLDDTAGSDDSSSDVERESEDAPEESTVERRGDDDQEQTFSDLSLPDNLEDLLTQWTTLDKQEIQRGRVEAF